MRKARLGFMLALALSLFAAAGSSAPAEVGITTPAGPAELPPTLSPAWPAEASATCSAAEKAKRRRALAVFTRQRVAQRRAFFRKTKSTAARRAFLKAQAAKLRALKRAAACQVVAAGSSEAPIPPPSFAPLSPPSSGPSCSPALTFPGPRAYFHLGPTNYDYYLHPTGTLPMLVLFVDFPESPRSDSTERLFSAFVPSAARWYGEGSYGRLTLTADRVSSWLHMPRSAASYDLHYRGEYPGIVARHRSFLTDVVTAADSQVDFGKYSVIVVVGAGSATDRIGVPFAAGTGVVADGHELRGVVSIPFVFARTPDFVHELGHLFGLPDNYDFALPFAEGTRNLGRWSPMSNTGSLAHFLGWEKWKLGWLDALQLRCVVTPSVWEETISPIEKPGGVKMIVLPTGATTAEIVEVHTLLGVQNQVCDQGVIVYSVDVQARSGTSPARIKPARDDPTGMDCGAIPRAAFGLGTGELSTFDNALMKLEVLATDGSSYRVRVTRK
jgi:M6 family metalloprotease-like protein